MISIEILTQEIYESWKVSMGGIGNGTVPSFEELPEQSQLLMKKQAEYLVNKFYFFRINTGQQILDIMKEEIEYWK